MDLAVAEVVEERIMGLGLLHRAAELKLGRS
jgi:hypothetical protein